MRENVNDDASIITKRGADVFDKNWIKGKEMTGVFWEKKDDTLKRPNWNRSWGWL